MDRTSLWVLLLVVILGGFIALYADRLGRKLGKKRLKLGSLRPRRTAEIIVFGAGMLTPLIAILAIMAVSAEARLWILRGYEAVRDSQRAVREKDNAFRELEKAKNDTRNLRIEKDDLENGLKELREKSGQYAKKADDAEARATKATKAASGLVDRVNSLNRSLGQGKSELGRIQGELGKAQANVAEKLAAFKEADKQREQANSEVERLMGEKDRLETQVNTGKGDLEKLRQDLGKKQSELAAAVKAQAEAEASFQTRLEKLQGDLNALDLQVSVAQAEALRVASKSALSPLTFRSGEEMSRVSVGRQLSQSEARAAVETLLRNARTLAAQKGVKPGDTGEEAGFIYLRDVSPEEQVQTLTNSLVGKPDEFVIVASAMFNCFADQFVLLQVRTFKNPVVIKGGEVLGEARIDGRSSLQEIFDDVGNLIRDQVRKVAEERDLIPIAGRDDAYGSVSAGDVFSLVSSIQKEGRTVRLQVLAKDDTKRGGPLALEFRLR